MTDLERFLDFLDRSNYPPHLISKSKGWRDHPNVDKIMLDFSGDHVHECMFWVFSEHNGSLLFSSLGA